MKYTGSKSSARWCCAAVCASALLMFAVPGVCLAEEAPVADEAAAIVMEAQEQTQVPAETPSEIPTETAATDATPTEIEQTSTEGQSAEGEQASGNDTATDSEQQAKPAPSPAAMSAAPVTNSTEQSSSDSDTNIDTPTDSNDPQDKPLTGVQYVDGDWRYYDESGNPATGWYTWEDGACSYFEDGVATTEWTDIDGKTYYFARDGEHGCFIWEHRIGDKVYYFDGNYVMHTGWLTWNSDKTRSYFGADGAALSGWQDIDGKRSYFDDTNWCHGYRWEKGMGDDVYYFDGDCSMHTGWLTWNKDKTRSYFGSDGAAYSGWSDVDGKRYYFDPANWCHGYRWEHWMGGELHYFEGDCSMHTGWLTWNSDKSRSYFGSDGAAEEGWKKDGSKTYYIDSKTFHTVRWEHWFDDKLYYFDYDTHMHTGWLTWNSDKSRSYFGSDGAAEEGWKKDGSKTYYIAGKTRRTVRWEHWFDDKLYYFDYDTHMHTGWLTWNSDKSRSYFGSDGAAEYGWKKDGSKRYYIDDKTFHTVRWEHTIDGNLYYFNGNYVMHTGWLTWNKDGSRTYFNADWRMANYGAALPIVSEKNRTKKSIEALCRDAIYWVTEGNLGYDQGQRYWWENSGYREGTEVDCSSFVIGLLKRHGFGTGSASYTGNMRSNLRVRGWKVVRANGAPQKGDILLNDGDHTALYVGDGMVAQASRGEAGHSTSGGRAGNQDGYETNLRGYYNYPWNCYLRYVG